MAERGNKGRTPARGRGIRSMRRQYNRRGLVSVLQAAGIPMPIDAVVYLYDPKHPVWGRIDLTDDATITISTKPYDRKDRR